MEWRLVIVLVIIDRMDTCAINLYLSTPDTVWSLMYLYVVCMCVWNTVFVCVYQCHNTYGLKDYRKLRTWTVSGRTSIVARVLIYLHLSRKRWSGGDLVVIRVVIVNHHWSPVITVMRNQEHIGDISVIRSLGITDNEWITENHRSWMNHRW